jgi:hypothetical protein
MDGASSCTPPLKSSGMSWPDGPTDRRGTLRAAVFPITGARRWSHNTAGRGLCFGQSGRASQRRSATRGLAQAGVPGSHAMLSSSANSIQPGWFASNAAVGCLPCLVGLLPEPDALRLCPAANTPPNLTVLTPVPAYALEAGYCQDRFADSAGRGDWRACSNCADQENEGGCWTPFEAHLHWTGAGFPRYRPLVRHVWRSRNMGFALRTTRT